MKLFGLLAITLLTQSSFANDDRLNETILKALNDVCGDTWCEGDYNLTFRKLTCNFGADLTFSNKMGACKVDFIMNEHGANPMSGKVESCLLLGYSSPAALTREGGNSYDRMISDRLYQDVSNCISALEALK